MFDNLKLLRPVKWDRTKDWRLTQKRGERPEYYKTIWRPYHLGLDYADAEPWVMQVVYAAHPWVVSVLSDPEWFGNYVTVDWWWYVTYYAHLSGISVKSWQVVNANDKLWTSWSTGNSTAVHLHFWLRSKNRSEGRKWRLDPTPYITNRDSQIIEPLPLVAEWVWSGDRPNEPATRKEVALMISRAIDLLKK